MQIKEIEISSLIEYENNPRNNDGAVDAVAESIKQFGFKVPIVIDRDNVIVAGHTRLKAARKIGLEKVPCIVADDLTPEQIKAFRLADNKTAELADWDFSALEKELAELSEMDVDFDMEDFGFNLSEIEEEPQEVVEDEVPEVDEEGEATVQLGDIWQLGDHRLVCGDSTDAATVERLMDGARADMVFTDPPYNVDYEGKTIERLTIQNDNKSSREFYSFLYDVFENLASVIKDGGAVYVCHAHMESINFMASFQAAGFYLSQMLIWNKSSMCIGRSDYQWKHEPIMYGWKLGAGHYFTKDRTQTTVWDFEKPARNGEHPTMKPVELCAKAINNSSHKKEIVLDVFGGSGSTLIACEQLGRRCFMMELDPKYCDVIIKRWETLTGEKAVKIDMN